MELGAVFQKLAPQRVPRALCFWHMAHGQLRCLHAPLHRRIRRQLATRLSGSQPELGGNPVSLRAPNRPLSGSVAFLGHRWLNTVQKSKGKAKNPLNGARQ
jgi:hypothetical protein